MEITHVSAQELPSNRIAAFTLAPHNTTEPVKIYRDFAMKTRVIIPLI